MLRAEVRLPRFPQKHIGSVDPYALKIPAPKGAEHLLTVERYSSISR